jgi:hypothetical protein
MQQQILCRCAVNSDLVLYSCTRGHRGLLCGHCLRTGCVSECPVCFSVLTVETPEPRYAGESPSSTRSAFSRTR